MDNVKNAFLGRVDWCYSFLGVTSQQQMQSILGKFVLLTVKGTQYTAQKEIQLLQTQRGGNSIPQEYFRHTVGQVFPVYFP